MSNESTYVMCSWCGEEGDTDYMYREGNNEHDWYHARCALKNTEYEIQFLIGGKK